MVPSNGIQVRLTRGLSWLALTYWYIWSKRNPAFKIRLLVIFHSSWREVPSSQPVLELESNTVNGASIGLLMSSSGNTVDILVTKERSALTENPNGREGGAPRGRGVSS